MLFVRTVQTPASVRGNLQPSYVKGIVPKANHGEVLRTGSHRPRNPDFRSTLGRITLPC
jgi:hypothetical protein